MTSIPVELSSAGAIGGEVGPNPVELPAKSSTRRFGSAAGQAPANKGRDYHPEPLTRTEVEALLAGCSAVSRNGIRNRALIVVMARAGLRLAETLALKPADIDARNGSIRVLKGKGRKARTVGLPPDASRHAAGSYLGRAGVSPAVIAAWLGHTDAAFTMSTYVHARPEDLAAARDALAQRAVKGE